MRVRAEPMLHFRDRDAHALAVFIAPIKYRGVASAAAILGAIARVLRQRIAEPFCPCVERIEVFCYLSRNLGLVSNGPEDGLVVAAGEARDDVSTAMCSFASVSRPTPVSGGASALTCRAALSIAAFSR